ncbi:Ba27 [Baboon cytomegalovirus]|nr:Ba27 [Baboon cytomegalovirus]
MKSKWTFALIITTLTHMYAALECTETESVTVNAGEDVTLGNSRQHGHHISWFKPPCGGEEDVLCRVTSTQEEMFLSNAQVSFTCKQKSNMLNLRHMTPNGSGTYCKNITRTIDGKTNITYICYNVTVNNKVTPTSFILTSPLTTTLSKETNATIPNTVLRYTGNNDNHLQARYNYIASMIELALFLFVIAIAILFCLKLSDRFWLYLY